MSGGRRRAGRARRRACWSAVRPEKARFQPVSGCRLADGGRGRRGVLGSAGETGGRVGCGRCLRDGAWEGAWARAGVVELERAAWAGPSTNRRIRARVVLWPLPLSAKLRVDDAAGLRDRCHMRPQIAADLRRPTPATAHHPSRRAILASRASQPWRDASPESIFFDSRVCLLLHARQHRLQLGLSSASAAAFVGRLVTCHLLKPHSHLRWLGAKYRVP